MESLAAFVEEHSTEVIERFELLWGEVRRQRQWGNEPEAPSPTLAVSLYSTREARRKSVSAHNRMSRRPVVRRRSVVEMSTSSSDEETVTSRRSRTAKRTPDCSRASCLRISCSNAREEDDVELWNEDDSDEDDDVCSTGSLDEWIVADDATSRALNAAVVVDAHEGNNDMGRWALRGAALLREVRSRPMAAAKVPVTGSKPRDPVDPLPIEPIHDGFYATSGWGSSCWAEASRCRALGTVDGHISAPPHLDATLSYIARTSTCAPPA